MHFSEMLGNFQHNTGRSNPMLRTLEEMTSYFRDRIQEQESQPRDGVVHAATRASGDWNLCTSPLMRQRVPEQGGSAGKTLAQARQKNVWE
jgi:hypothetical protein